MNMKTILSTVLTVLVSVFIASVAIAGDYSSVAGGEVITGQSLFPLSNPTASVVTEGYAWTHKAVKDQVVYPFVAGGEVITGSSLFPLSNPTASVVTEEAAATPMAVECPEDYACVAGGEVITGSSLFPLSNPLESQR